MEQSGGLTSIIVTGSDNSDWTESTGSGQETEKRIDDQLVEKISKMDHVKFAAPIYETSVILLKGAYTANVQLKGMTPEGLKSLNIDLGEGTLPKTGTGHLDLVFGNDVIRNMGYNVETNAEYLNSMKSQFAIVQAVLGGIGAVSLLVAAIS